LAELLEDRVETSELLLGDVEVLLERGAELLVFGGLDHLRQRLDDLALDAMQILELILVELLKRVHFHGVFTLVLWRAASPGPLVLSKAGATAWVDTECSVYSGLLRI